MKIYYASQSFYPHIGGVSTYLLNLCREMVEVGNDVIEVHLRPSGVVNKDEIKGIRVIRVPREPIDPEIMNAYGLFKEAVYKGSHYDASAFARPADEMPGSAEYNRVNEYFGEQIRELLKNEPADIVHIHDFQLLFAYKYVPRGTPLVLTWHIPFIDNMPTPLSEFLIRHMKEYDKVVFSSPEYISAAIKAGLPEDKKELIYPIPNTELFRVKNVNKTEIRAIYGIPPDARVILCVQRIDAKSGHEQLIRAMPQILEHVPEALLVFVGGKSMSSSLGPEREALTRQVRKLVQDLGLAEQVVFTGNIDYNLLPELYNSVDIVALCSKNEGFGLSVTEGMACGNPIVGTDVGGLRLQVQENVNGFLVGVGDVPATAQRVVRILKDPQLRERMSQKSVEIVNERFKMEIGVEKHLKLYNQLINRKNEFRKIEYLNRADIRGIVTDLDGTITDKVAKLEFDAQDFDAALLSDLKALNIDLFLATGRSIGYVRKLCTTFKIWRCAIAENGAVLYFPETRKTITIASSYMRHAKALVRSLNLAGATFSSVIVSIKESDLILVRERLGPLAEHVRFIRNIDDILIVPADVDKGLGTRLALQYLNIDPEKTILVGDGENDIDLFLNPGFKIALANSHQKLKDIANQVIDEPSASGIREIIRRLNS